MLATRPKFKKLFIILILLLLLIIVMTSWANLSIKTSSEAYLTENISKLPNCKVGLLLGTSKKLKNGKNNQFFFNRIDAAVELYKKGKIKYIIISGDNSQKDYNEPEDMKTELMQLGIPDSVIYLDYAGFRTLDSVIRANKIFGQTSFIVISQKFHNERAVFIARKLKINAFGYNAKDVDSYSGFKTKIREFFARDKVYLDFLFGIEPKFLGDSIKIE